MVHKISPKKAKEKKKEGEFQVFNNHNNLHVGLQKVFA